VQASALVFELVSCITERRSIGFQSCKAQLYKCEEVKLNITNIFTGSATDYANFSIQVINIQNPAQAKEAKDAKNAKKKKSSALAEDVPFQELGYPGAFFEPKGKVRIKRGDTVPVMIQFMPFRLDTFKCLIVFVDPQVGEFQHEIVGETTLPDPQEDNVKPNVTIYVDGITKFDYPIPFKNPNIINMKKRHENR